MRLLLLYLLITPLLFSRENPFLPLGSVDEAPVVKTVEEAEEAPLPGTVDETEATDAYSPTVETEETDASSPTVETEEAAVTNTVEKTEKAALQETRSEKQIINFQNLRFIVTEDRILFENKDKLKKHFAMKAPPRIILDFESNRDYPTRSKALKFPPFQTLRLGKHKGFYRIVIELDEEPEYSIKPYKYGYVLSTEQ